VNDVTLPLSPAAQPFWLVPANTNQLVVAAQGTVVRGFIGVDTFNSYTVAEDELVNVPYTDTVG
jgi:hypothetical protein